MTENKTRSAATAIITFVLLNLIWTGALQATADQHIIAPGSDIVQDYPFTMPDLHGRDIPLHVMFTVEPVEGAADTDVVLMLEDSNGERTTLYSSSSEGSDERWITMPPGPSMFILIVSNSTGQISIPKQHVVIDLETEMDLYGPIQVEGYIAVNILALTLLISDRAIRGWLKSRRRKRSNPMMRKLHEDWKATKQALSGGDAVDVEDLTSSLAASTQTSSIGKRRAWSLEAKDVDESEHEKGDQDIEDAEAIADELDALGEGDESRLQGKAEIDEDLKTVSDLWDRMNDDGKKRR
tara:strand:+ start:1336 stop:2223 length:888 start_codon:yes stop_codon:yes gene_type:complete